MNISSPKVVSFLGLKLNQHCDWNENIDCLSITIRKGVYMLGCLRDEMDYIVLSLYGKKTEYFAHVNSHIKRNVIFWGHAQRQKEFSFYNNLH
jgi:hypothetical protein